jgi:hypothetical protein
MSDDEYVAIQKLTHPITGATVYLPEGQAQPDSKTTLEQDGPSTTNTARARSAQHPRIVLAIDGQRGGPPPRSLFLRTCLPT